MSKVVLDASAILAFLYEEPGAEKLTDELLAEASISTVNITEAATKLIQGGDDPSAVWRDLELLLSVCECIHSGAGSDGFKAGIANSDAGFVAGRSRLPRVGHCR